MTIKDIARICGVSRGTVDRVLNNRGKVNPDTEALIRQTMQNMGYTKNIVARALTVKRSSPVIGVILCSEGNPFFDMVLEGIYDAQKERVDYGVSMLLRTLHGYDVNKQLEAITALEATISALVIQPINDERIEEKIAKLKKRGIPTITINSDLPNSSRCCYVGSDYESGGSTAAGLMRLATQGKAKLGIIGGVDSLLGHTLRQLGFEKRIQQCAPQITIVAKENAMDNPEKAFAITTKMLTEHTDITALFVVAMGLDQVCKAVLALGREHPLYIVGYDDVPATRAFIQSGVVCGVVCQQPYEQGYRAFQTAFDCVLSGSWEPLPAIIMDNQVKLAENV